jgi:serine protease
MSDPTNRGLRMHVLAAATAVALSSIVAGSAFSAGNAGSATPPSGAAGKFRFAQAPIEGQYIVVLKDEMASLANERSSKPAVADMARALSSMHGAELKTSYTHVLRGFVVRASDRALAKLLADERVAYVEEDGVVRASATQSGATWGLDRIDQRDLPLSNSYTYDTTASSVHAYIIDTGIRSTHTDFGGRVSGGYTAISDGNGTSDCNGHGTHVAGTVGGNTWGVAKAVRLHPVRVLGCNGSGTNSGVIAGMDWVTANHVKPAVANMSLGGGASTATDDAVTSMTNAGVTVAVAAGNDNANACNYSPARAASAITVGSTTNTDARSSFSNYGTCLDIFGPGSSITSAWSTGDTATNTISGTSMASPHVAGVAALYLAVNPTATPSQVTTALINNSTSGKVTDARTGSPNRLLYSLFSGDPPPPTDNTLTKGVAVTGLSASTGNSLNYTMSVPAGSSNLNFNISGGSGDADMYVKFGSAPTDTSYDCRPYKNGNVESCSFASPAAGTWYVRLKAYSTFSGVSLIGDYDTSTAPCTGCTKYTDSLTGSGDSDIQPNGTYYNSSVSGKHEGWLKGPSGTDFDLELYKWDGSKWVRVARAAGSTSDEYIGYSGTAGYYYWKILSYSGGGSYDFWLKKP